MGPHDRPAARRVRVAYYSPLPPDRSGVADYSALLLPALGALVELEIVSRPGQRVSRNVDLRLFHIGNNPGAHGWILEELERSRGVVVLHDFVVHHLVAGVTLGRGDALGYLDAMQGEAGVVGRSLAHAVVDGLVPPLWEVRPHEFPLTRTVIQHADGLIVHSYYVEEAVSRLRFAGPVWRIPMPAWPDAHVAAAALPREADFVIGCFGHMNPSKRIPELLTAFDRLRKAGYDALLVLAGLPGPGFTLRGHLDSLGLREPDDVVVFPYVEEHELWSLAERCDVCVNLRWPTMGETSGAALRMLSLGKPLVVSDVGWFSELPDAVAAKVPVDEWEIDMLAAVLARLAGDERLRAEMGAAAVAYTEREHALPLVADRYLAALEEAAAGAAVREAVLRQLSAASYDVGFRVSSPELGAIARRVRGVLLGG